ncbi:type VI immunity family protein [Melittangium boletus]|uniref:type VI immunity family protein n=1 Tax=Melittangium boletus TaxID=83453 RepID=UPI000BB32934|nr:type VI immunity family protein [Melittangium boletus]
MIRLVLHLPLDHYDLSVPVRQALDLYLSTINQGPEVLSDWYDLETEPFPQDEESWEIIRAVMAPPRGDRFLDDTQNPQDVHRYIKNQFERAVELSGGTTGVSGYGFFYRARLPWRHPRDTVSLVSFSWPTEYLEEQGPKRMRELILELASSLPFSSGHAGLAFSSTNPFTSSLGEIREEAFRYPGIDVTHGCTSLGHRIDGVHWINLLGPSVLGEVGGINGLHDRLCSPGTHLQELERGRAVVTLGEWPRAGDISRGDSLPDHRELARALEPWLSTCPDGYTLEGASPSETRTWWRRFLDS